jgi:hypothetical protein
MPEPKYRRSLNNYQISLLTTLYKFRFATSQLITKSEGSKSPRVITSRLKILLDQDYIGRNYDSTYKIKGKPASYFLRPKSVRYLRQQSFADKKVLNSIYHDKRATSYQINHRLSVFEVYVAFKHQYSAKFAFYSKSELNSEALPKALPDAYLRRIKSSTIQDNEFFLDYLEDSLLYRQLIVSIRRYVKYAEDEDWEKEFGENFPIIILVCESKRTRYRVSQLVKKVMDRTYVDIYYQVITKDRIMLGTDMSKWPKIPTNDEED